jgi:hypothetical protein
MPEIKGTDVALLRELVKEKGRHVEEAILAKLSDKEKDTYRQVMTISWTPLDVQARICQVAAEVLYPNAKNSIFELHFELAKRTYTGLYKVFLAIPSLQLIVKRAASIWRTYYNAGEAMVENSTDSSLDFVVTNFPELPPGFRESTSAHLIYLAQATGKKGAVINRDDSNPKKWVWHISWQA